MHAATTPAVGEDSAHAAGNTSDSSDAGDPAPPGSYFGGAIGLTVAHGGAEAHVREPGAAYRVAVAGAPLLDTHVCPNTAKHDTRRVTYVCARGVNACAVQEATTTRKA